MASHGEGVTCVMTPSARFLAHAQLVWRAVAVKASSATEVASGSGAPAAFATRFATVLDATRRDWSRAGEKVPRLASCENETWSSPTGLRVATGRIRVRATQRLEVIKAPSV